MVDLKKLRRHLGYSQREMADILGCKQANYSVIERGDRQISEDQMENLKEKLGEDNITPYMINLNNQNSNNIQLGHHNIQGNNNKQKNSDDNQDLIELLKEQQKQTAELIKQNQQLISLLIAKENGQIK